MKNLSISCSLDGGRSECKLSVNSKKGAGFDKFDIHRQKSFISVEDRDDLKNYKVKVKK